MDITYDSAITLEEYAALRASAGWPAICEEQARAGLAGSRFVVVAKDGGRSVGLARVVTDGGFVAYLADVLVLPEYQRRGIGSAMVGRLVSLVRAGMKEGYRVNFVLLSATGKESFYERLGFKKLPSEQIGHGMMRLLEGPATDPGEPSSCP